MTPITKADIDRLRRRIERIEGGRMEPLSRVAALDEPEPEIQTRFEPPERYDAETLLDGTEQQNEHGRYFLQERFFPLHKLHGGFEIARLQDMPGSWLEGVSKGEIAACDPSRWVFLDTETTGLAGGTGTCAFLVGVGAIEPDGFRVRLFFMRDYDEEAAMLHGLAQFLSRYEVLVTYNGKSYDAPLLETRYRLRRLPPPLEDLDHLDLLHGARSLFKLRMESCRLVHLERELLGVERQGDLPGELIPYYYFEYLRTRQAFKLAPMFHHNVMDIVSLACLTHVVLPAFAAPEEADLRHGQDLLGLARWLRRAKQTDSAVALYRRAIQAGMHDHDLFQALWEQALAEKKRADHEAKAAILEDLVTTPNAFRAKACEELARHHERVTKDLSRALELTLQGLALAPSEEMERRRARLEKRLAKATQVRSSLFEERKPIPRP
ncbi:MAG: hypothetical protein GC160_06745 [Acidobacteria bacterium]|nr:hypothetical protein [Acidobacteriota bacterium]